MRSGPLWGFNWLEFGLVSVWFGIVGCGRVGYARVWSSMGSCQVRCGTVGWGRVGLGWVRSSMGIIWVRSGMVWLGWVSFGVVLYGVIVMLTWLRIWWDKGRTGNQFTESSWGRFRVVYDESDCAECGNRSMPMGWAAAVGCAEVFGGEVWHIPSGTLVGKYDAV